jgi:regulator of sigma E protease
MVTLVETIFTNPIIAFILLVGVVVFVHELGHYVAGRLVDIDVEEFSLGFGPKAFGFRRGLTEFKVCWLPLGGYVRFYGSEIGNDPPPERRHRALLTAPVYKRATISIAGPLANFVLSFAVMVGLSAWGMPQAAPVVAVVPGMPAERSGLRDGDRIVAIEGEGVETWVDLNRIVTAAAGRSLVFSVEHASEGAREVTVTPSEEETQSGFGETVKAGRIGVTQFFASPRLAVREGSPLWELGFRSGDEVLSIDGKSVKFGWQVRDAFERALGGALESSPLEAPSRAMPVVVKRAGPPTGAEPPAWEAVSALVKAAEARSAASKETPPAVHEVTLDLAQPEALARAHSEPNAPLLSFTELTLGAFEALPKGDSRQGAQDAWKACGFASGDTLLSLGDAQGSPPLASPVQLGSWLERVSRETAASTSGAGDASRAGADARMQRAVSYRAFAWNGALRQGTCTFDLRMAKDTFGRDQWTLDFPLRFLSRGVPVDPVIVRSAGVADALADGARAVLEQAGTIFTGLRKLVTGSLPMSNLGGPIAIARVAGDAAQGGALLFILTISWMSINIGMFNLLPLPALDGGSLLLQGVEAAYGKPLPVHVQATVQKVGVLIILVLFVLVFYNDILRLFTT